MRILPLPLLYAVTVLCFVVSCQPSPKPEEGLGSPGIVECGKLAVSSQAAQAIGPINGCLAGDGDVFACLLGLVRPAVGVTVAFVGCMTRHEGAAASSAAHANPGNAPDAKRAARASEFLGKMSDRGWTFTD